MIGSATGGRVAFPAGQEFRPQMIESFDPKLDPATIGWSVGAVSLRCSRAAMLDLSRWSRLISKRLSPARSAAATGRQAPSAGSSAALEFHSSIFERAQPRPNTLRSRRWRPSATSADRRTGGPLLIGSALEGDRAGRRLTSKPARRQWPRSAAKRAGLAGGRRWLCGRLGASYQLSGPAGRACLEVHGVTGLA